MHQRTIIWGFINCLIAVVLGAFGAHSLKAILAQSALNTFEIGVRYQFYHGLALCIIGLLSFQFPSVNLNISKTLFLIGIVLFSGSLYLLACKSLVSLPLQIIGPLTPIGGLCFISGWIILIIKFFKLNTNVK